MRLLMFALLGMLGYIAPAIAATDVPQIKVMTTFSVLGDITKQIGGNYVLVGAYAGPGQDAEKYQSREGDSQAIAVADIVIANGLGLEDLWLPTLVQNAKGEGKLMIASKDVTPQNGTDGKPNPYAWQSVPNALIYVKNIRDALINKDKLHADFYRDNAEKYMTELRALDAWIRAKLALIPADQRSILVNRDALAYFGKEYEIKITKYPEGLREKLDPAPRAFFLDNIKVAKDMKALESKSMKFGGKIYTTSLDAQPPANSYIGLMRWNATAIADALIPPAPAPAGTETPAAPSSTAAPAPAK